LAITSEPQIVAHQKAKKPLKDRLIEASLPIEVSA